YICGLLRGIYPEKDERAILPRARAVAAHFIAEDDTESSVVKAGLKIRGLTQGLETRVERTKLRLLKARVEWGDRSMPVPCRVYTRN
ncbi:hypothetical protein, partial [Methylobacterium sp. WL7]|uniref:hypothetical protein n=1 Tax=Methylobacterium sp. WL7 TaxID=2603900 RepID=UPI001AEEE6C8